MDGGNARCAIAVLLVAVAACGADPEPELAVVVEPDETVSIQQGTQATFGDLRIGIGNFWEEPYTDARGEQREGLTAGMWLFFRVHPSEDRHLRVHPGQRVDAGAYAIEVVEIEEAGVIVRVTPRRPT